MEFDDNLYEKLKTDIADKLGVRATDEQKRKFREYIKEFANQNNLKYTEEIYMEDLKEKSDLYKFIHKNKYSSINVILGDIQTAKIIFCAHYDTAYITLLSFLLDRYPISTIALESVIFFIILISAIQLNWFNISIVLFLSTIGYFKAKSYTSENYCNYNDNSSGILISLLLAQLPDVAIIFFDNEEKGLVGSKRFAHRHSYLGNKKLFINFDCVGNGKYLILYTKNISNSKKLRNMLKMDKTKVLRKYWFLSIRTDALKLKKYKIIGLSRSQSRLIFPRLKEIHTMDKDVIIKKKLIKQLHEKIIAIVKIN